MRIWSLHPSYLDPKGLVALWRETLLAQNVLAGRTKGYRNHPQLDRFKATSNPLGGIATYLREIAKEADRRGYRFDATKICSSRFRGKIPVTSGQLEYERSHLLKKLRIRAPDRLDGLSAAKTIAIHPIFEVVEGGIEAWEVTS